MTLKQRAIGHGFGGSVLYQVAEPLTHGCTPYDFEQIM